MRGGSSAWRQRKERIWQLVDQGLSNGQIRERLGVSKGTVIRAKTDRKKEREAENADKAD
jgi:transposase